MGELARAAGLSPSQFTRRFRARFGLAPAEYARALRVDGFKRTLRGGGEVTDAIYAAGFGSPSRVYEDTARLIGMTPGAYRRRGEGLAIRYTVLDTPIGRVLVAATERGVCAIMPGADDATLEQGLAEEFPRAERTRVDEGADGWLAEVVSRIAAQFADARGPDRALPADLRATAFQWQVWNALTRIPRGETRSYAEVARDIGRPTAARAVARACASNRLALIVPCHRVIREDGSMGGYRWGLQAKEALLHFERKAHNRSKRHAR
jgi:AraC family transcriptional regulator of adaptative response/methylated-DNA-[protein]-cysteine methyltransferase